MITCFVRHGEPLLRLPTPRGRTGMEPCCCSAGGPLCPLLPVLLSAPLRQGGGPEDQAPSEPSRKCVLGSSLVSLLRSPLSSSGKWQGVSPGLGYPLLPPFQTVSLLRGMLKAKVTIKPPVTEERDDVSPLIQRREGSVVQLQVPVGGESCGL